jgi:hypothetical protein
MIKMRSKKSLVLLSIIMGLSIILFASSVFVQCVDGTPGGFTIDWISFAIGAVAGITAGVIAGIIIARGKGKKMMAKGTNISGETETPPTPEDQKTKDKSKKDYVGHVTLMK